MFRPMRRIKQQLSEKECKEILKSEPRGVLGILGDNEYPYTLPMNFFYDEAENKIYFHCAKEGHKTDAVQKHDKVSFCVYDKGYHKDGHWSLNIRSVIVFGKITICDNQEKAINRIRELAKKHTPDTNYIEKEIQAYANKVACLELTIEHMTGKLVNES